MLLLRVVASGKALQALHIVGVEHSGDREVLYVVVGIAFQQFRQCAGRHDFDFYVFAARQCTRGADTQAADEREDFVHRVFFCKYKSKYFLRRQEMRRHKFSKERKGAIPPNRFFRIAPWGYDSLIVLLQAGV